jgi:hypothetical protein
MNINYLIELITVSILLSIRIYVLYTILKLKYPIKVIIISACYFLYSIFILYYILQNHISNRNDIQSTLIVFLACAVFLPFDIEFISNQFFTKNNPYNNEDKQSNIKNNEQ